MKPGTTTSPVSGEDNAGDHRQAIAELTEEWTAVALPHSYKDGTTHRWAVLYKTSDGMTIEIADWLTKDAAHVVAAAPNMLAALKEAQLQIEYLHDKFQQTSTGVAVLSRIEAAITKATP